MNTLVSVNNLSKNFSSFEAVKEISFSINESEIKNFKMYGSARKLYNFNIDNVSEY